MWDSLRAGAPHPVGQRRPRGEGVTFFAKCGIRSVQDGGLALSGNRVSVYEAAKVLGITVDDTRKRIQQGTIRHGRDDNGRVRLPACSSSKPYPESRHLEPPPPAKVQVDSEGRDESMWRRLFLG